MTEPRVYTTDEVRDLVIQHVHALVRYWSMVKLDPGQPDTVEERVGGVAFSILSMLDGSAMDLPSFIVAPAPHPDDEAYRRKRGRELVPSGTGHRVGHRRRPARDLQREEAESPMTKDPRIEASLVEFARTKCVPPLPRSRRTSAREEKILLTGRTLGPRASKKDNSAGDDLAERSP